MATITINGVTSTVNFFANAADSVRFMNGLKTDLLSHTLSIACHVLKDSNTAAFKDMDMFFAQTLDKTIRRFVPMTFNKEANKWELNKERADKIREKLGLVRGQFDFDQLCEAISLEIAQAEIDSQAKQAEQAVAELALMAEQGLTKEQLDRQKEVESLVKYMTKKIDKVGQQQAFDALLKAFPQFGAMYMVAREIAE